MTDMLGRTLGPYTITQRLGRGGMAEVYKAYHAGLSVHRAIKVIHSDLAMAADFRARFQQEAQAVASLRHPNIVQVADFGSQDGTYYMVMEFVDGQDLKKIIQTEGAMRSIPRAVEIVIQLADALAYAHDRHIVHRDVKPENVMLSQDGTPVLMDFGIARLLIEGTRLTQTGTGMGTPAYMAPEQATGAETVGPPADVYALSIVLYELLTGQVPFSADTPVALMLKALNEPLPQPRRLRTDVSDSLERLILTGAAKRPEDRYATGAELRDALKTLAAQNELVRGTNNQTTIAVRGHRRRNWLLPTAALVFVTAAAAWWLSREVPVAAPATVAKPQDMESPVATDAAPSSVVPAAAFNAVSPPVAANTPAPVIEVAQPSVDVAAASPVTGSPVQGVGVTQLASSTGTGAKLLAPQQPESSAPDATAVSSPAPLLAASLGPAPSSIADGRQVQRDVTTQRDLLRMFGGPDIATRDRSRREVWVYQRSQTATDSRTEGRIGDKAARLGVFFGAFSLGADGALAATTTSAQTTAQIRTLTVTITFGDDRTVADYQVESTHY